MLTLETDPKEVDRTDAHYQTVSAQGRITIGRGCDRTFGGTPHAGNDAILILEFKESQHTYFLFTKQASVGIQKMKVLLTTIRNITP